MHTRLLSSLAFSWVFRGVGRVDSGAPESV